MLSLQQGCEISIIIRNFIKVETEAQRGTVMGLSHTATKEVNPALFTMWSSTNRYKTVESVDSLAPRI